MKNAIEIIIICAVFIWIAQPNISYPPLRIHFDKALLAIGFFLVVVGSVVIILQVHTEAYTKGLNKGCEIQHEAAIKAAKQIIEEAKNQSSNPSENQ